MATSENGVPARLKDLKESVKERFLGLLGLGRQKGLEADVIEDEQEVFLQVGRQTWHAPRQLRVELWLSSLARRHALVNEYQTYLDKDVSREAAIDIEKDVQRTFPSTRRFRGEEGQTQLRNVLRAYAAYDPEVAYCQGMNFLTGLLLMYMPTEGHAFAALVVLMEDRKLRNFYHRSMSLLQVQLWQLSRLISPALNRHLEALGVVPMLYGASWLMTAFSADFPLSFSARIMDVLLADQCEGPLLKVAAFIMKAAAPKLLHMMDLEEVLGYLKIEVPSMEEDELHGVLQAAFTKPWTKRQRTILATTEGAETVAQAMDRVLSMIEQAGDDDEDGDVDGRVAVIVPRLDPPPRHPNSAAASFAASPACATPVGGGPLGTGSIGGAGHSPPACGVSPKRPSEDGKCEADGGEGELQLHDGGAVVGSPAVWGIPSIHPNVAASPALQAFRRAHLPCFVAGAAASTHQTRSSHNVLPNASGLVEGSDPDTAARPSHVLTCVSEEWSDFNMPASRQHLHWRSLSRSTPGTARQQPHNGDEKLDSGLGHGAASSAMGTCSSATASLGGGPAHDTQLAAPGVPTQPIPVPWPSSAGGGRAVGNAFSSAAAAPTQPASGRPPLPPRHASCDRGPGPCSRLSVVAEDPPAVQMGPAAPAPSPRGSMDMYVLGRAGSQQLEGCEYGLLLCGGSSLGGAFEMPGSAGCAAMGGAGSASCNGDCASGTASATTGGAFLSPSGISGAVSPHAISPRILSGWNAAAGAALAAGAAGDTPTVGYVPLGLSNVERAGSDTLLDHVPVLAPPFDYEPETRALPTEQLPQPPSEQQKDMAADIAGDILRMLTAVDTGSAVNVNNARAVLQHETMYADSPHKDQNPDERLCAPDADSSLSQLPSCGALAELAAQDLAKAQEEAERMRQEMDAELQQRRAAERGAGPALECIAPGPEKPVEDVEELHSPEPTSTASEADAPEEGKQEEAASEAVAAAPPSAVAEEGAAAAAADAPAPSATDTVGGAGPSEEFVLRRPTLYVDGIPMFDPRGLMADSQEAKVMFTPAVSPGAGSYAEPATVGATPTAEISKDASDPAGEDEEAIAVKADSICALACDGCAEAEPEAEAALESETASPAPKEPEPAVPAAPSPAPSEWVDWSQAPPIQASQQPAPDVGPEAHPDALAEEQQQQQQDLVDMACPPGPLQTGLSPSGVSADAGPAPVLQPAQPPSSPAAAEHQEPQPVLAAADSVHLDPAAARQLPYGLLPAMSTLSLAQSSHSLSRAASVAVSAHAAAHGGAADPQRLMWTQVRSESFAPGDLVSQRWESAVSSDADCDGTPRAADAGVGHLMLPRGPLQPHSALYRQSNLSHSGAAAPPCQTDGPLWSARLLSSDGVVSVAEEGEEQSGSASARSTAAGDTPPQPETPSVPPAAPSTAHAPAPATDAGDGMEPAPTDAGAAAADAGALPQLQAAGLDQHMNEAEVQAAAAAESQVQEVGTPMGQQGSCEMEGEAEEGDSPSPYRAALSPSLAHHIMSAYLRSEQHEQQQQQRELEERLLLQQVQELQDEEHPERQDVGAPALRVDVAAVEHAPADAAAVAPAAGSGAAPTSALISAHDDLHVVPELSLCSLPTVTTPTTTPSGLASPFLSSPSRIPASVAAAVPAATGTAVAVPAVPACQHAKALTPFAVSLDDPCMSRLSAELLQAMPPPPPQLLLQPETPALHGTLHGSGCPSGSVAQPSGLLGFAASSEAEADAAHASCGAARLGGGAGMHSITLGVMAAACTHAHPAPLRSTTSQDAAAPCTSAAAAVAGLHPPSCFASGIRSAAASTGGAVPPLLPPPPPPQVPLCQTALRHEATPPSAPALAQAHPAPASAPLPPQPLQCISAADVLCVAGAADSGSSLPGGACPPQPAAPSWTATFDDAPAAAGSAAPQLAVAVSEAANAALQPLLPPRGSAGHCPGAVTASEASARGA